MRTFLRCLATSLLGVSPVLLPGQTGGPLQPHPGITSQPNQVSLFLPLRVHSVTSLTHLQPGDLTIRDSNQPVNAHEAQLTPGNDHPLLTVIFDRLPAADRRRAAQNTAKLMKELKLPPDRPPAQIALWQTDNSLQVVQPLTGDRTAVAEALHLLADGPDPAILAAAASQGRSLAAPRPPSASVPATEDLSAVSLQSLADAAQLTEEQHLPVGIASVFAAAAAQRSLDGRKAILLFTESVPTGLAAASVLRTLYEQLSAANISLYLVDLQALDRTANQSMATAIAMGTQVANTRNNVASAVMADPLNPRAHTLSLAPANFQHMTDSMATMELGGLDLDNANPLATVAVSTGGVARDLDANPTALGRALNATLLDVVKLTYPQGAGARDSSFHNVIVTSSLRDVSIASSLGYFADGKAEGPTGAFSGQPGSAAAAAEWHRLEDGATATDLSVRAGLRHATLASGTRPEVAVQVSVDQLELRHDHTTGLLTLHVTLAAELADANGQPVARFSEDFHRRGAAAHTEEIRAGSLTLLRPLALPAGDYQLHARVRDWFSGKLGETTTNVILRAAGAATPNDTSRAPAAAGAEPEPASASVLEAAQVASISSGLSAVAGSPLPPPQSSALLEAARTKALAYADSLPNFLCMERIDRSMDAHGAGLWRHRDDLVELLRYTKGKEARTLLERDGQKTGVAAEDVEGARSNGEFGAILDTLFAPDAGTVFTWQGTMEGEGETLQVFHYQLGAAHSRYFVTDSSRHKVRSGLHGLLYIDTNTEAVRRLLAQTDELPADFGIRRSWMSLEYNYLTINNHEYLLPTRGEAGLQQRKGALSLLQLHFSDYRRFGSRATLHYGAGPDSKTPD